MNKRAFEVKLEQLNSLRSASRSESTNAQLRTALSDRNNYVVARAATICAELKCEDLIPDLIAAFDRLLLKPEKQDPRCLAKNEIVTALRALGSRDPQPYLRGIVHVQLEPTWGGRADSAATLRGTCALGLSESVLDDMEILTYLADALADPEKVVRID